MPKTNMSPVKEQLLRHMKEAPQYYHPALLRDILDGRLGDADDYALMPGPMKEFIESGQRLTWEEILGAGVLPRPLPREVVTADEDMRLPVYSVKQYEGGIVAPHRTDVFILGVAGTGKSSLACSLIRQLVDVCEYEYQPMKSSPDDAKTADYYNAVMDITLRFNKPVAPSLNDNLLFTQLRDTHSRRRLTIIDGDSNDMSDLARINTPDGVIFKKYNIYRIMGNRNSKILLLLFNYRQIKTSGHRTMFNQSMLIERFLNAMTSDGSPDNPEKDSSFSRLKGLVFVFTKCDNQDPDALNVINRFLEEHLKTVMMRLDIINRRFGINKENGYRPYILPVTLGQFTIGNTFIYNPETSINLAKLITSITPTQWPWQC
ncbi:MAG: hypothetical protein NC098_04770 [Lachnoclostridium sp.]|nr:hypothetical protein [Lachnoclostridium sp.]